LAFNVFPIIIVNISNSDEDSVRSLKE
jgi:hypothetical protein